MTEEGRQQAVNVLKTFGIEGLVVIGGDGSLTGGLELSKMGIPYDKMEEAGIISPVLSVNCQYRQMTRYGETVTITPVLSSYNGIKYVVSYEIRNKETGVLNATGETSHCFLTKYGKIVSLKKVLPETHAVLQGLVKKEE
jgi:acyl-CoA thioester hydrolase